MVSGGRTSAASGVSSKPTMLSSPGTAIPRASAACSAPTAISSLIAISAVGRSARRWERLWVAARRGATLPPISVFRLGEEHFVDDGHHRVSVAHALGMTAIDAEVTDLGRGPARLREA